MFTSLTLTFFGCGNADFSTPASVGMLLSCSLVQKGMDSMGCTSTIIACVI